MSDNNFIEDLQKNVVSRKQYEQSELEKKIKAEQEKEKERIRREIFARDILYKKIVTSVKRKALEAAKIGRYYIENGKRVIKGVLIFYENTHYSDPGIYDDEGVKLLISFNNDSDIHNAHTVLVTYCTHYSGTVRITKDEFGNEIPIDIGRDLGGRFLFNKYESGEYDASSLVDKIFGKKKIRTYTRVSDNQELMNSFSFFFESNIDSSKITEFSSVLKYKTYHDKCQYRKVSFEIYF